MSNGRKFIVLKQIFLIGHCRAYLLYSIMRLNTKDIDTKNANTANTKFLTMPVHIIHIFIPCLLACRHTCKHQKFEYLWYLLLSKSDVWKPEEFLKLHFLKAPLYLKSSPDQRQELHSREYRGASKVKCKWYKSKFKILQNQYFKRKFL